MITKERILEDLKLVENDISFGAEHGLSDTHNTYFKEVLTLALKGLASDKLVEVHKKVHSIALKGTNKESIKVTQLITKALSEFNKEYE